MSGTQLRLSVALAVAGLATAASAQMAASGMKAAVQQAIEHGQATFWASSAVADNINRRMGRPSGGRVKIALQARERFNADCARLNARFIDESDSPLFELQMNLCKDGSPPLDGVDLAQPIAPEDATLVPRLKKPIPGLR